MSEDPNARISVAVVGHVEWATFAVVPEVPAPGQIVHASAAFEVAAGGGGVAAAELAARNGSCTLFTALGDDENGHRAAGDLAGRGVTVRAVWRPEPQRRALVHLDDDHERAITVLGARLSPGLADSLPWEELAGFDAIYLTAADAPLVQAARRARILVATTRAIGPLRAAGVGLDALVASAADPSEREAIDDLDPRPALRVLTAGRDGGTALPSGDEDAPIRWDAATPPGPASDSYGAGDCFAAGLTLGLGRGLGPDAALAIGARFGADCVARRGPYGSGR